MNYFSRAFLAIIALSFSFLAFSKVDPPNYDFSLDKFKVFMPGEKLSTIQKKMGKGEVVKTEGASTVYRFYVAHIRYKFPVLVQFQNGEVTDFHARLPAYFLHNIFHQSLINRLGPQNLYKKDEEQAVYIWKNKEGKNEKRLRHIYSGACTITCFPVYYAVLPENTPSSFQPVFQQLSQQLSQEVSK